MTSEFVSWYDSASHGDGWHDIEDIQGTVVKHGLLRVESVGFLVHEDNDSVTLAVSWSPDNEGKPSRVANPLTIPKAVITSRSRAANSKAPPQERT